jgi:peroxiredoxin
MFNQRAGCASTGGNNDSPFGRSRAKHLEHEVSNLPHVVWDWGRWYKLFGMRPDYISIEVRGDFRRAGFLVALFAVTSLFATLHVSAKAQGQRPPMSDQEKAISDKMRGMRQQADEARCKATLQSALDIRKLPASSNKVGLANGLANLSTEVDCGQDTLQAVATVLSEALREQPQPDFQGGPAFAYVELAQLVRYENLKTTLDTPSLTVAMAKLEQEDRDRQSADFTLQDLKGQSWKLKGLKGKVVVVNFWATWCPPCRKEMPDMEALYERFEGKGLVILGISDEKPDKVKPFIAEKGYKYTFLLDPDRKVNDEFHVQGIPRTFIYDRAGKLVAQAIDARSPRQFLALLAAAGLQ